MTLHAMLNMRPWILLGLFIIVVMLGGSLGWAMLARIHGAVIASGSIAVESNIKTVQHPDGGIVKIIYKRNGDAVRAGEPILELDDTALRADLSIVSARLDELKAEAARLQAEREGSDEIIFPLELVRNAATDPAVERLLKAESNLLKARKRSREGEKRMIRQRIQALKEQIKGLRGNKASLQNQQKLLQNEIDIAAGLVKKGLARKPHLLALQRDAAQLIGELRGIESDIAKTQSTILELGTRLVQIDKVFLEKVLEQLRKTRAAIVEFSERKVALEDKLRRLTIIAPVSGRVHNMTIHTIGGVVSPARPILQIIPEKDELVVRVRVRTVDIDQIHGGQDVRLVLSAFEIDDVPKIMGRVTNISPAEVHDEKTGEAFYVVEIEIPEKELARLPENKRLIPGMPVEAFIRTRKQPPIAILMEPFIKIMRKALRES